MLNAIASTVTTQDIHRQPSNIVKDLFTIGYDCKYVFIECFTIRFTCEETGESYTTKEEANRMYCNIRGGSNEDKVNYLSQVLR